MAAKTEEEKARYKEEVKKRLESYKVGNDDGSGNVIEHIFGIGDEHVIYKIVTDDKFQAASFKVYIDTFDEDDEKGIVKNFGAIRSCLDDFRSVVHLSPDLIAAMQRAANAVTAAIMGNVDGSIRMFQQVVTSIKEAHKERLKFKGIFLSSYIAITIIASLVCLSVYLFRNSQLIQQNIEVMHLFFTGTAGILGGFISVSTKLHLLSFETQSQRWQIGLHAFERATYSFVLGIIGYFLVKNDMLLAFVKNIDQPLYGYMICSCAAGISERFIPDKLVELQNNS